MDEPFRGTLVNQVHSVAVDPYDRLPTVSGQGSSDVVLSPMPIGRPLFVVGPHSDPDVIATIVALPGSKNVVPISRNRRVVLHGLQVRGNPVGAGQAPRFRVDSAPVIAAAAFSGGHVHEGEGAIAQHSDLGLGSRTGIDDPVRGVNVEAFRPGAVLIRSGEVKIPGVVVVDADGVVPPSLVLERHGRTAFAGDAAGEGTAAVYRHTVRSGLPIPGQDAL